MGKTTIYLVWADDRLLVGPYYYKPFTKSGAPTKESLLRGQAVVDGDRLYVRLFDGSDPNRAQMRISSGQCLLLQAAMYTIWRGMNTAWGLNGYKLEGGSSHNVLEDAELHHHGSGILEAGDPREGPPCEDNTFRRLEIHHVGVTKYQHGIYTSGTRTRVLGCRFHHITGAPLHAYPKPLEGVYDGNIISDPLPPYLPEHFRGENPPEPSACYTAFICWGRGGHRLTNNLIVGPFSSAISVYAPNNAILNNTLAVKGHGVLLEGESPGLVVRNNILCSLGWYIADGRVHELDHNAYFGGRGWRLDGKTLGGLADLRKLGFEAHGTCADPQFVDAAHGNYHLAQGSPLRDAGASADAPDHDLLGARRPQGTGVDLGAYEEPLGK